MKLNLDDSEQLKGIISAAIFQAIDEDKRAALIKSAIAHLLTPPEQTGYMSKRPKSPLEEAYQWAIESQAKRMANDILETDETVKAQVRGLLTEAMERAFVTNREATVERVATAIAEGMWKRDGER